MLEINLVFAVIIMFLTLELAFFIGLMFQKKPMKSSKKILVICTKCERDQR